ncbi:MAG: hypothetical protein ABIJ45_13905 [Candidatus Zixiibacteriota bacterium]
MKRSRLLKKIKNSFIYYFVVIFKFLVNIIPRSAAILIGGGIGRFLFMIYQSEKSRAFDSLQMVYGDTLTKNEKIDIVCNFFVNSGKNLIDVLRFKKYYKKQIADLVTIEGREHFDQAYRRGKGIIAITGHIGNFELLAVWFANNGYNCAAIGREMYDRRLDRMLVDNRESMGIVNIDTKDSPKKVLKVLKDGYALGVLIDTDSKRVKSEFIPAFGHLSRTPVGQSILGLKTGAAFIPMACVRDGNGYKIIIRPEIIPETSGNFDKDVYNITQRCTEALDKIITEYKDQWIWIHNRWRSSPEN